MERRPRYGRAQSNEVTADSPAETSDSNSNSNSVSGAADTQPSSANESTTFQPHQVVAGRYLVERLLGRGGMGEVYQVFDRQLAVAVALKTVGLRHSHRRSLVERLEREVRLARRITHPNVCRVYDVAAHDPGPGAEPIPFVTMEYLPGENLADLCARTGPLAPAVALPILEQLCAALTAAHDAGVVHRDLKPHNVMLVASDGAEPRAVVTDFGLAGSLSSDGITVTADSAGSPVYMAPEQVLGQPCGPTADIYALGVMAFEMVSGRPPFVASGGLATAALRIAEPAPSPRTFAPTLPSHWEEAILRCLRREPSERFPDAAGVIAALRGAPAPASAPASAPAPAPTSWLRRARVPAAMLVIAALGLAAVVILRQRAPSPASHRSFFTAADGPVRQAVHVAGPGNEIIEAIAREPDGSLYITGHASDAISIAGLTVPRPESGSKFGFVAKLDRDGRLRWRRTLAATDSVRVSTLALDGRGGVVVAGQYAGRFVETTFPDRARAPGDCFVLMLDAASGATRWGQACGAQMGRARSAAVDSLGRTYVAGEFDGPATFGGRTEHGAGAAPARGQYPHAPFVAAYGLRGELRWVFAPNGASFARCKAFAVVEDAVYIGGAVGGELAIGGAPIAPAAGPGALLAKLDPETGAPRWVKRFAGEGQAEVVTLAVSPDRRRIAAGGTFRGRLSAGAGSSLVSTEDHDGWIALFDVEGGFQAATALAGPGFESARNVAFAPDGTLLAAGRHQGEVRVGSARLDTENMREDLFILTLDATAAPRRLTSWGGPGEERSRFMRIDRDGLVTVTGRFEYRLDVGAFTATAQGASDGYMVQFDPAALIVTSP